MALDIRTPSRRTWDTAGMLALLQGTRVTLGGVNGERPSFYAAGVAADELVIHSPIASQPGEINAAFDELRQDLNGTSPLTEPQREARFSTAHACTCFR